MYFLKVNGYRRVHKKTAIRYFEKGKPVYLCPSNMRPGGMWGTEVEILKSEFRSFNDYVIEFGHYNCNKEAGSYVSYWVKEDE